jgi:23S rRNA pseudouridine955/2504/2580 synthase
MAELVSIAPDDDGIRIDRWFKRHYPALTHGRLEKLLRKGEVRLDGKRAKAADRVTTGQNLRLPPQVIHDTVKEKPKPAPRPEKMGSLQDAILYMDKHVIVLNKPSGLATQGGTGLKEHVDGMLDSLAFERTTKPKLVHRLDRDTSGVLVVARTTLAASGLSRSLAQRDASKIYWALVKGSPKEKRGLIRAALVKEGGFGAHGRDERMTTAEDDDENAKHAITEYVVVGEAGGEYTWIAAKPVTGRTHQIRVHLASLGTPIIGDFKYGGAEARGRGEIADRLHLHARSIDIARPDGGRLYVLAPLPPHMLKSWQLLGFDPDFTREKFKQPTAPAKKHPGRATPHRKETAGEAIGLRKGKSKPAGSSGTRRKS